MSSTAHRIDGTLEGNTFEVLSPGYLPGVMLAMRYPTYVEDIHTRRKLVWRVKASVKLRGDVLEGGEGPQEWIGFPRPIVTPIPSQKCQAVAVAYFPDILDASARVSLFQFTFTSPFRTRDEREDPDRVVEVWGCPLTKSSTSIGLFRLPFTG